MSLDCHIGISTTPHVTSQRLQSRNRGLFSSVLAVDIAQFFPSINHDVMTTILIKLGFDLKIANIISSFWLFPLLHPFLAFSGFSHKLRRQKLEKAEKAKQKQKCSFLITWQNKNFCFCFAFSDFSNFCLLNLWEKPEKARKGCKSGKSHVPLSF